MLWGEELQIKYMERFDTLSDKGIKAFINSIDFSEPHEKKRLINEISDDMELIWYPGCGGDVSPCSVLERKEFERNNDIVTTDSRIYIFTDPDRYGMCEEAFGSSLKIYDCSVEDYKERYSIKTSTAVRIKGKNGEQIIAGYYVNLSIGDRLCKILYLKMTMQDFWILIAKSFMLRIKWLFFLKMESGSNGLFRLFDVMDSILPEWICANRIQKFGIDEYAELKPMVNSKGISYYIDEDRNDACNSVMFGRLKRSENAKLIDKQPMISLLKKMNVLCRDNRKSFDKNKCERIDVIKKKLEKSYYFITQEDIFVLCHKKDLSEYGDDTLLISTHIDCKQQDEYDRGITQCFSNVISENLLRGTYDNSITNTAVLYLMIGNLLPDNVIVAFTGDEEEDSNGAISVTRYLKKKDIKFKCIVLDVTDAGWNEEAYFTVENNFWGKKMGKRVIQILDQVSDQVDSNWIFVPEEMDNIPDYIKKEYVYSEKSEPDESWDYDEENIKCFSLCIPVYGDMHSDEGVFARINSLEKYISVLKILADGDYF